MAIKKDEREPINRKPPIQSILFNFSDVFLSSDSRRGKKSIVKAAIPHIGNLIQKIHL